MFIHATHSINPILNNYKILHFKKILLMLCGNCFLQDNFFNLLAVEYPIFKQYENLINISSIEAIIT